MIFNICYQGLINEIHEYHQSLPGTRMSGLGRQRPYSADKGFERGNPGEAQGLFLGLHESVRRRDFGRSRFPAGLYKNQEFPGTVAFHALYPAGNALRVFPVPGPPPNGKLDEAGRLLD